GREVVEPDDVDLSVLLVGQRPLGKPGVPRSELQVPPEDTLHDARNLRPELGVEQAVSLESDECAGEFRLRLRELVLQVCDVNLVLFALELREREGQNLVFECGEVAETLVLRL